MYLIKAFITDFVDFLDRSVKEMKKIWYLLKCPEGNEKKYAEIIQRYAGQNGIKEVVCFEYQRMLRYGGRWHLERRPLLTGWIFLSGTKAIKFRRRNTILIPCEAINVKSLCQEGNLIGMSRGIIQDGKTVITSGPLKGREDLIKRINRHKRTAYIEIPFADHKMQVTVGLEIYEKNRQ